jgi:hypothetical protein
MANGASVHTSVSRPAQVAAEVGSKRKSATSPEVSPSVKRQIKKTARVFDITGDNEEDVENRHFAFANDAEEQVDEEEVEIVDSPPAAKSFNDPVPLWQITSSRAERYALGVFMWQDVSVRIGSDARYLALKVRRDGEKDALVPPPTPLGANGRPGLRSRAPFGLNSCDRQTEVNRGRIEMFLHFAASFDVEFVGGLSLGIHFNSLNDGAVLDGLWAEVTARTPPGRGEQTNAVRRMINRAEQLSGSAHFVGVIRSANAIDSLTRAPDALYFIFWVMLINGLRVALSELQLRKLLDIDTPITVEHGKIRYIAYYKRQKRNEAAASKLVLAFVEQHPRFLNIVGLTSVEELKLVKEGASMKVYVTKGGRFIMKLEHIPEEHRLSRGKIHASTAHASSLGCTREAHACH